MAVTSMTRTFFPVALLLAAAALIAQSVPVQQHRAARAYDKGGDWGGWDGWADYNKDAKADYNKDTKADATKDTPGYNKDAKADTSKGAQADASKDVKADYNKDAKDNTDKDAKADTSKDAQADASKDAKADYNKDAKASTDKDAASKTAGGSKGTSAKPGGGKGGGGSSAAAGSGAWTSHTLTSGGLARNYMKYVPAQLEAAGTDPAGLVIFLHGVGHASASAIVNGPYEHFGVAQNADRYGFIGVVPTGSPQGEGSHHWNVDTRDGVDEVAFIQQVKREVVAAHAIPAAAPKIAQGFSNGAGLAAMLGCHDSSNLWVAHVAVHIRDDAANPVTSSSTCTSNTPTWNAVGTDDFFISGLVPTPGQGIVDQFAALHGSSSCPSEARAETAGPGYTCHSYSQCAAAGQLCVYAGLPHELVANMAANAWAWLTTHTDGGDATFAAVTNSKTAAGTKGGSSKGTATQDTGTKGNTDTGSKGATSKDSEWICGADGFWLRGGQKTQYSGCQSKVSGDKVGASKDSSAAKPGGSKGSVVATTPAPTTTQPPTTQTDRRPGFCARRVGSKKAAIKARRCKKLNIKKKCPASCAGF